MFTQNKTNFFSNNESHQNKQNNYNSDQTLKTQQYFENRSTQPHSSFNSEGDCVFGDNDFEDDEENVSHQTAQQPNKGEVPIILLPMELQDFWPSLASPEQLSQPELQQALSVGEFEQTVNDMTAFIKLVLKIGFNFLHLYQHNPTAKARYEQLFEKSVSDFDAKAVAYFEEFVFQTWPSGVEQDQEELAPKLQQIEDQYSHMLYSSQVVMLRALKTLRIQEAIGKRPQEKYLFAGACIAAANKCESNILVQPLYIKSLAKATFLAQSYAVIQTNQAVDLVNYEQWKDMYYDHLIQMHNGIIQALDLNLEVVFPITYISKAVPLSHPCRPQVMASCRQILQDELVMDALFRHPKELAVDAFDRATFRCQEQMQALQHEQQQLDDQVHGVKAQLNSQEANENLPYTQELLTTLTHLDQMREQNQQVALQLSTFTLAETAQIIQDILMV